MTAAKQPLVERVAITISQWMNNTKLPAPPNWERLQESTRQAYRQQAKAAIAACHAAELESVLRALLEDTQHRDHDCGDVPDNCPVLAARTLLAEIDSQPPEQTA